MVFVRMMSKSLRHAFSLYLLVHSGGVFQCWFVCSKQFNPRMEQVLFFFLSFLVIFLFGLLGRVPVDLTRSPVITLSISKFSPFTHRHHTFSLDIDLYISLEKNFFMYRKVAKRCLEATILELSLLSRCFIAFSPNFLL